VLGFVGDIPEQRRKDHCPVNISASRNNISENTYPSTGFDATHHILLGGPWSPMVCNAVNMGSLQ